MERLLIHVFCIKRNFRRLYKRKSVFTYPLFVITNIHVSIREKNTKIYSLLAQKNTLYKFCALFDLELQLSAGH